MATDSQLIARHRRAKKRAQARYDRAHGSWRFAAALLSQSGPLMRPIYARGAAMAERLMRQAREDIERADAEITLVLWRMHFGEEFRA